MKIETRWNVADKVWGVRCDWLDVEVPCEACHTFGGATIPGTGVFVRCQECRGKGCVEKEVHRYRADENVICSITVRVDSQGVKEETYYFNSYDGVESFLAVEENQEDAWDEAAIRAAMDEDGELAEDHERVTTAKE